MHKNIDTELSGSFFQVFGHKSLTVFRDPAAYVLSDTHH